MKYILSPSMLSADFRKLGKQFKVLEEAGVKWLHIDVMDGHFVPNISFGMPVIKSIRKGCDLFFDVHLMIDEPIRYIEECAKCGADLITVHLEACSDVDETLDAIKAQGKQVGLSIKPGTPAEEVIPYLDKVNMILVMTVEPGFGGQSYIKGSNEKIAKVRKFAEERGLDIDIQVDGGINKKTVIEALTAGANIIVAGSSVFEGKLKENAEWFHETVSAWKQ